MDIQPTDLASLLDRLNLDELRTLQETEQIDLEREIGLAIERNAAIDTDQNFSVLPPNGSAKYAVLRKADNELVATSTLEIQAIEEFDPYDLDEKIVRRIIFSENVTKVLVGKSYGAIRAIHNGTQNRFGSKYRKLGYYHFIIVALFIDEERALELEFNLHKELGRINKFDENAYNSKGGTGRTEHDYWVVYLAIKYN